MIWLCVLGAAYLLYRAGSFWLWKASIMGSWASDRLAYGAFMSVGVVLALACDVQYFHAHLSFSSVYAETAAVAIPAICLGEFLYLRKATSILHTLSILRTQKHGFKSNN